MKPKSRILSLLLAICLVAGLMPTAAFAAGTDTGKAIQLVDSGTAANIGGGQADNIYFGTYQQSSDGSGGYNIDPIKWRVLENADGQLFLLSDQNLDVFQYHTDWESVTWEKSTMRSWLNGYSAEQNTGGSSGIDYTSDNFIGAAFSEKEQGAIADTTVVNDDNPTHGTEGGNDTTDKIFLLSIAEANNGSYFANDSSRIATNTAYVAGGGMLGVGEADNWWLRSPGSRVDLAAPVNFRGGVFSYGNYVFTGNFAVRPAFNLDLTSVLFTSAAAGGKSANGMDSGLTAIGNYAGNEWKLTLLDDSRDFSISNAAIEGSTVTFSYSNAKTGENEYISAIIKDNSGNITHYGRLKNTTEAADASGTVNIDLSGIDMTSKTLYVFSEQYNGDYMTDYASALQKISLNVLSKETTPQAVFTAAGDSSGTLSNVDASMKYSVDGGASWTDITGTTAEITGVTADKDIQVVKKGDGTATADSDAQIIDVTQAATPTGLGKTDCKTAAQNDGTITGVDSTMEYRLSAASEWTSISGNTVSGLANGTYEVRVRANGTVLSSEVATVTIGAHTCAAQGGWHSDETGHWNTCECGEKLNEAAHTFEWVIDKEATAAEAGSKHEECTVCGYAKAAVEIPATGETTSPETGDNSNIALWIAVMLAAGTALTGTVLYSRKRKYSR